ncbi:hypothetical protein [Comamonas testosteroni]|uniref:hypothetical protein n=1 Tax=Comamonas testosteroni TaxID=285 RepID=UPI00076D2919|nr:hypothetical protein [Comamonas testosteroni]KWT73017.1 Mobile element protein [Comamonas testosteroni]
MKNSKFHFRRVNLHDSDVNNVTESMSTQQIICTSYGKSFHLLPNGDLIGKRVSSFSFWHDDGWTFDAEKPGAERTGINWKIDFSDGTNLINPFYAEMLDWLKRLVWSLMVTPGNTGAGKAVSGMDGVNVGMRTAVKWLQEFSIFSPAQITERIVSDFVEDLPMLIGRDSPITFSQLVLPLRFFDYLWQHSEQLSYAGIKPMPENPFPLSSPSRVATEMSEEDIGWIDPLPDEVAILTINGAQKFIERYGDEISELVSNVYQSYYEIYFNDDIGHDHSKVLATHASKNVILDKFSKFNYVSELFSNDFDINSADDRMGVVRGLMLDLAGACIIVMLGCTGMRISELASINTIDKFGRRADRFEKSLSGIFEVFYISSALIKGELAPRGFDWLAGMRLIGSEDVPPVIRSYRLLENIFFYPRKILNVNSLFVSMPPGRGIPKTEKGVGCIFGGHLRRWIHNFLEKHVDFSSLPNQSMSPLKVDDLTEYRNTKGRCIKPTQFRKSFASFSVQVDPRVLPAIALHFKHVSHAITETGYIGNNPGLLIDRNSLALQRTAKLFFDVMSGSTELAGRRGVMLEKEILKKHNVYSISGPEEKWAIAEDYVRNIGVYAWFEPEGGCLPLDTSEMLCYRVDDDRPKYGKIQPKFENRRVSLCSGCKNYFLTNDNKEQWISRFRENYLFFKQQSYFNVNATIFERRASTASAWLRRLGHDVEKLRSEVDSEYLRWLDTVK